MAFNCTAHKPERFHLSPVVSTERCDLVVETGFDPAGPATFTYYLTVHTYFNAAENMPEFGFGMAVINNSTGQQFHTYKAQDAGQVIPIDDRVHVRALLHHYTPKVISATMPRTFLMETYDRYLLEKALAKYQPLCHIFSTLGYQVVRSITASGKTRWVMSR